MKKIVSVFLCFLMLACCVIPASATGFDSTTNGYSIDVLPYLESTYFDISNISVGSSMDISFTLPDFTDTRYVSGIVQTTDIDPGFSSAFSTFTVKSIGDSLYYFYGLLGSGKPIIYTKGSSASYLLFLSLEITPLNYIVDELDFTVNMQGSYTYRDYAPSNPDQAFSTHNKVFNKTYKGTVGTSVYSLILDPNINTTQYTYNEQSVFITSFVYFDWTGYDRIDMLIWNGYDELYDYVFYVDGVNVLRSQVPITISGQTYTMISLDFSDLDPNVNSHLCYLKFRGYKELNSSVRKEFFQISKVACFIDNVSDNFWPSWLTKIIDKLDNIFTGRDQDQAGANSFNDSINDQADELEDLTADLNSVTRPPLSDVNLSTSGMVDQSVVVLSTNGIGSILSNQIILRVLIMSLTFALAGFILFGKR